MFLVCGEALYDLFVASTPEGGQGRLSLAAQPGGSPFNVAVGLARQGARVALHAGVSTDALGERLAETLRAEGVELGHLVRTERPTTLSLVDVDADGAPAYAFYGANSADHAPADLPVPRPGPDVEAIHLGSYLAAAAPMADRLALLATRHADRFLSIDPNARPTILDDARIWRERLSALRRMANLIKLSREDADWLYPGASPDALAAAWLAEGVEGVVVTDGPGPVRAYRRDEVIDVIPPTVELVDTVGAGDAFQAALLAALAAAGAVFPGGVAGCRRAVFEAALVQAAAVAADTCARRGADIPRRNPV